MPEILPVTDQGVTVPHRCFGDATAVELRQEQGIVVLVPVKEKGAKPSPYAPDDPIMQFGRQTFALGITDASANLDKYVYGDLGNSIE